MKVDIQRPNWCYLYSAFAMAFYCYCDGLDGAQGRKVDVDERITEHVDHGLDSKNTIIISVNTLFVMNISNLTFVSLVSLINIIFFYVGNFQEIFLGKVRHYVNGMGVTEAQFIVVLTFAITGIFGKEMWTTELYVIQVNHIIISIMTIFAVLSGYRVLKDIYDKIQKKTKFLYGLIPITLLTISNLIIFQFDHLENHVILVFLGVLSAYVCLCLKVILFGMSKGLPKVDFELIFYLVFSTVLILNPFKRHLPVLCWLYFISNWAISVYLFVYISQLICNLRKINFFTL